MKSGIYKIKNLISNKFYIGSAENLKMRIANHINRLRANTHINLHLQRSFNKHGIENFIIEEIEFCNIKELLTREQYYIDTLKPQYNICKIAGSKLGVKCSEATKLKISNSNKGRVISEEARLKISNTLKSKGYKVIHSEETKRKISESNKGKHNFSKEEMLSKTLKSLEITQKKVDLIDDNGNIVETFESLAKAGKILNIDPRRISACVTKVRTSHKGMKFQYHID